MVTNYIEDQLFENIDFSVSGLKQASYENCRFLNCNFANCDFSNLTFTECLFNGCELSMIKIFKTGLKDVRFKDSKVLGVHFEHCNTFLLQLDFDTCMLNLSSFFQLKLKKIAFKHCSLHETDFTETDLTEANFENCDLSGATFENSLLEKADFRSSYNYSINPEMNYIKKAKFSLQGLRGLLNNYDLEIE